MRYSIIFSLFLATVLTSCGSDTPPIIDIINPVTEEVPFGASITFRGTISDDLGILSISYAILEMNKSIEPFIETSGTNTDAQFSGSYTFNEDDVNNSMVTFRVTATDNGGNISIEDRGISLQ